jgi:site-specific recombinase XerD
MNDSMTPEHAFSALLETWLISLVEEGKSVQTVAAYRRALTHFAVWHQRRSGAVPALPDLTRANIEAWKAEQQTSEQAAPSTINQRLVAITRFCHWAVTQGVLPSVPTSAVAALPTQPRAPEGLPSAVLRHFLQVVHAGGNLRDRALIELLAGTGIRVSECLALQRADLNLDAHAGTIAIRQSHSTPARALPLPRAVGQALRAYLATLPPAMPPDTPLWTSPQGGIAHRSTVLRLLRKYTDQAGLAPIGPQTLRHTFAIRYLTANPHDLRGLAAVLGHATLSRVMLYSTAAPDDLAQRMERAIALTNADDT